MSKYFITLQPQIANWHDQLLNRKDEIKEFLETLTNEQVKEDTLRD